MAESVKLNGNPLEGQDPGLSAQLVQSVQASGDTHILPAGYESGEPIVGIPAVINPDFNKGVVQGPHPLNQGHVDRLVSAGIHETDAQALVEIQEKQRRIGVNTYPLDPAAVEGPIGETYHALAAQANGIRAARRPGH